MLSFGLWEMAMVVTVALIFVGPERLPTMVRFLGRQYGKLMRASNELRRAFILEADRVDSAVRSEQLKKLRLDALERAKSMEKSSEGTDNSNPDEDKPYKVSPIHRGEGEYVPFDLDYHGSDDKDHKAENDVEKSENDKDQLN